MGICFFRDNSTMPYIGWFTTPINCFLYIEGVVEEIWLLNLSESKLF
jgi:hypothetical protein